MKIIQEVKTVKIILEVKNVGLKTICFTYDCYVTHGANVCQNDNIGYFLIGLRVVVFIILIGRAKPIHFNFVFVSFRTFLIMVIW